MASSKAATVEDYLAELPPERREVVARVRALVRRHLPKGYAETMNWGMISYEIPRERYPDTYNGQPLGYVALAAQKNNYALYLMALYTDAQNAEFLRRAYAETGRRPDMGKSCLRFKRLEELPQEALGSIIASMPVDAYIARYEASRRKR